MVFKNIYVVAAPQRPTRCCFLRGGLMDVKSILDALVFFFFFKQGGGVQFNQV